ncbi:SusC/RagA family TonB-linked outer membrane protein [Chitinophaga japonensis]|uniref:TonB-linked SusC/RagA family outer membrane protein n=1 Tax=Chitinophaga japonensis TaxID=104662 RepID=A0A562TCH2_CHIJA|nr:TonB-dependent receptor [Chitinophaga japonensis]TWI91073.1 TonB-linked SusC/RagA family outer membrane protein [Chitinophaga japonensis]
MKNKLSYGGLWLYLLCHSLTLYAQSTIQGKVTDAKDGAPLPGVTVSVKGKALGTQTNMKGEYQLKVPGGQNTLVFSFIGYLSQEQAIDNRSTINIVLQEDLKKLDEVVVVGYGQQKRRDVTGSIVSIGEAKIKQSPVLSAAQALQGRAPGVYAAQSSNRPGADARIQIRGRRSFNASSDPLYVIDGIPIYVGISELNPNDIASMEVLKDASATAIYGSRGANGVILITTKRGKAGKVTVDYNGYTGVQEPLKLMETFDGPGYAEYRREAFRNTRNNQYPSDVPDKALDEQLFKQDATVLQNVLNAYDANGNYDPSKIHSTDWGDLVLRTGFIQNHQVSVTAGNDKTKVLFSASYYQNKGIIKNQDYTRWSLRLNVDQQITDAIRIGMSSVFSSFIQNYGSDLYSATYGINPLSAPYDSSGKLIFQPGNDAQIYNPLFDVNGMVDERRKFRFLGSFFGEVQLAKGLKYRINFGPDYGPYRQGEFRSAMTTDRKGGTAWARIYNDSRFAYTLENLLFYNKDLKNHSLGVTLLQSIQEERFESSEEKAFDLPYESQGFYNIGTAVTIDGIASNYKRQRLASFMGRINYSYKDKYLLTLSTRADGSSVLASDNKFDFFPSAALAWRVKQEPFMQSAGFFDDLKLRLGYGVTGNSSVDPYETLGSLTKTSYAWDDVPAYGFRPDKIPNPLLHWERTAQYNVGLDFTLLKGRIAGTVDAYLQRTSNLIMDRQLPTASGFPNIQYNVGETSNRGLEVSLNTLNVDTKSGFRWTTDWMFYTNRERIERLYGGKKDDIGNKWFIGQPIGVIFDYRMDGIWQNTPEDLALMEEYNKNGSNFAPGKIRLGNVYDPKEHKITADDRAILGYTTPRWIGSLTNTFSYKGLELMVFIYTQQKYLIRTDKRLALAGRYNHMAIDYWTPTNTDGKYPRPSADVENVEFQDLLYYEDGSFVKVKTATLGYNLPQGLLNRLGVRSMKVYVSAENPFMFTKADSMDPEVLNDSSSDRNFRTSPVSTPTPRSFLFGLNVGF